MFQRKHGPFWNRIMSVSFAEEPTSAETGQTWGTGWSWPWRQ